MFHNAKLAVVTNIETTHDDNVRSRERTPDVHCSSVVPQRPVHLAPATQLNVLGAELQYQVYGNATGCSSLLRNTVTTHDDEGPPTVTDHYGHAGGRHLSTADVVAAETTGYFDDCAAATDFRLMANRCWTGNGSGFDTLSSSMAAAAAVAGSHNFWTLLLLVFPVLTVFGNVLVVLGVYREEVYYQVYRNATGCVQVRCGILGVP